MIFDLYKKINNQASVKLYAEMIVQYEDEYSEATSVGTPKWWDDTFLKEIDIYKYDIYFICTSVLPHGTYNSVSDYKKIWGLNRIDRGIYDNTFLSDYGKVYFGIVKAYGESAFRSSVASTMLLVEKDEEILCDDIFELVRGGWLDAKSSAEVKDHMLRRICAINKCSYLLKYNYNDNYGVSLCIYGEDANKLFSTIDVSEFIGKDECVVYRKP